MKRSMPLVFLFLLCVASRGADYVIAVSVDGMGASHMQSLVDAGKLPYFKQLEEQGAWTTNARTDHDITVTLPNHVTMITSRPIMGSAGHGWIHNTDPAMGMTLHSNKNGYIASVFDVAHDNGKRTGLWAGKSKFSLFAVSYGAEHGAPDTTGEDNGRRKLDVFVCGKSSSNLTDDLVQTMTTNPCQFAFVHFAGTDSVGHGSGWGSEDYNAALITLDGHLGRIMDLIAGNAMLKSNTVLIVTADHGGTGQGHSRKDDPLNYTIPLLVWGAGVTSGDLYKMNPVTRRDPEQARPAYDEKPPPIRNGEVGNLALHFLGLGPIPGSGIGVKQDMRVGP